MCEMIKATTEGAREFGSVEIRIVLTFSDEAASIVILVEITRFFPSMISLGVRIVSSTSSR